MYYSPDLNTFFQVPFFGKKDLKRAFSEMTKFEEANLWIFINIIVKEQIDDCSYLCLTAFLSFFLSL